MLWPITLNNNQTFQVRWCGAADGVLWIDGLDMSFADAVFIFSDISKTSKIIAYRSVEHNGYTELIHISISQGLIKIALRKAE